MDRLLSMRVFQRVIDEGGFAAAARALELSPAAVTRLIGDLETHLGARLIQRTSRRLSLTDAGERYLDSVRNILREIEDAESAAVASTRELHGTLHILSTPVLATHLLAPRIARWRALHPGVSLDIVVDPFPQHRVESFDVSFLLLEDGVDLNVVARPLAHTDMIVCASPAYLARAGTPLRPEDLVSHHYLKFPWQLVNGLSARRLRLKPADGSSPPVEVDMPVALQSASFDVLYRATLEGAGIAALSTALVRAQLESGALVHVLPGWIFGRFTIYAALPTRKLLPARTRAFLDFLGDTPPRRS
ncbi:LysR family transcriptional regulator [Variovorax ginsengisoli]|uniref:DNA-binding transcriptional LysR family regulator n=1 Tax=Variovorax ginsengisoli TaxID=363844 RepID=A0ABT9S8V8_9BURK|nr:LysR family transcriptional regulator [Variovorax ginsengisoli]MDP9900635.1 DNA-binding transcriptional LysR family regulator [Variovorax ginsengisoli]